MKNELKLFIVMFICAICSVISVAYKLDILGLIFMGIVFSIYIINKSQ